MYTLEGISSVANFITAYEESQLNQGSHFLSVMYSLFPKAIFFTFILLYCSWCKCRVAAVKRLPVLHHSADYIFNSFGITGPIVVSFKWSSAHVYAKERKQCCKLHYCLSRVSIKQRLPFSICNVFFVSKGNLFDFH